MTASESPNQASPAQASIVSESAEIAVPPELAYAAVSDVTRMGEWSPETYRVRWLEPGKRFRGWNRRGIARWATQGTVVTDEPGREFVFDVDMVGIPVARWGFAFAAAGDGRCTVTETWTDRRSDGLVGRAVRVSGRILTGTAHDTGDTPVNLRTTLERLRACLETS